MNDTTNIQTETPRPVRCSAWLGGWHVTWHRGMAAKGDNGDNPPWLGRCWGFWLPRLRWNRGLPWRHECADVTAQWLCFWVGFTVWPFTRRNPPNDPSSGTAADTATAERKGDSQ